MKNYYHFYKTVFTIYLGRVPVLQKIRTPRLPKTLLLPSPSVPSDCRYIDLHIFHLFLPLVISLSVVFVKSYLISLFLICRMLRSRIKLSLIEEPPEKFNRPKSLFENAQDRRPGNRQGTAITR